MVDAVGYTIDDTYSALNNHSLYLRAMSVNVMALRAKLINYLATSHNEYLLKRMYALLASDDVEQQKITLNKEQQLAVSEAREEITNGYAQDATIVDAEIEAWLLK